MYTTRNIAGDQAVAAKNAPMSSLRKTALFAGLVYILTFISIPTLSLYQSIHDQNYVLGSGPDTPGFRFSVA